MVRFLRIIHFLLGHVLSFHHYLSYQYYNESKPPVCCLMLPTSLLLIGPYLARIISRAMGSGRWVWSHHMPLSNVVPSLPSLPLLSTSSPSLPSLLLLSSPSPFSPLLFCRSIEYLTMVLNVIKHNAAYLEEDVLMTIIE